MQQTGKQTEEISDADWRWAAAVFDNKGGFMQYGTSFAARIHSIDVELIRRLLTTFGGSVGTVAGTLQWRLSAGPLVRFLRGVRPLLKEEEFGIVVDRAIERIGEVRKRRGTSALETTTKLEAFVKEVRAAATPALPPASVEPDEPAPKRAVVPPRPALIVVRELEEEAFGRVPAGPWDGDQVLFEMVQDSTLFPDGMLLEAEDTAQAEEFAAAARKIATLRVAQDDQWVRLWRATSGD